MFTFYILHSTANVAIYNMYVVILMVKIETMTVVFWLDTIFMI